MRLPGYCERCHRIRQVRVRVPRPGALQVGICDSCQEKADEKAKPR
jgi:hypothetical protein